MFLEQIWSICVGDGGKNRFLSKLPKNGHFSLNKVSKFINNQKNSKIRKCSEYMKGYKVLDIFCWTRGILPQVVKFWALMFWTDSVGWTVLGMKVMVESVGQLLIHGKCWAVHILFWIFPR